MPFDAIPDEPSRFLRIFRHARAILARRGAWVKGDFKEVINDDAVENGADEVYGFCLIGALNEARNMIAPVKRFKEDELYDDEIIELSNALGFYDPESVTIWNDADRRTKRAVMRRIDRAMAKLEAGETVKV